MKNKLIRYLGLIVVGLGLWLALAFCIYAQEPLYYSDRGDPVTWDYVTGDGITCNSAWHSLDVSSLVPSDTVLIHIRLVVHENSSSQYYGALREYGNSNAYNVCAAYQDVSGSYGGADCLVAYAVPYIDYYCSTGMDAMYIGLRGFWRPAGVGGDEFQFFGYDECSEKSPISGTIPIVYDPGTGPCWEIRFFDHTSEHEAGGIQEISINDLGGVAADLQKAGWIITTPITITDLAQNHVLAYNGSEWVNQTISATGGFTMPNWITATISGTVPVVITSTYHMTETLTSGHDIGIIRSFTYGEASIAIALFALTALLGLQWLLSLMRK